MDAIMALKTISEPQISPDGSKGPTSFAAPISNAGALSVPVEFVTFPR